MESEAKNILFKESEEGDWVEMFIDGEQVYSGHSLPYCQMIPILEKHFGCKVERREFTIEQFESGDY